MITPIYNEIHIPGTGGTCRGNHLKDHGYEWQEYPTHINYDQHKKITKATPISFRRDYLELAVSFFFKCKRLERTNKWHVPEHVVFDDWVKGVLRYVKKGHIRELENHKWYWRDLDESLIYPYESFPEIFYEQTGIVINRKVNSGNYGNHLDHYTEKSKKIVLERTE